MKNWIRTWLGINRDLQKITMDTGIMATAIDKTSKDVFDIFHALPFVAGVLSLQAADAAKFINPFPGEQNALIPLLTAIVMATRQGDSSLQVSGELSPAVRLLLQKRGFKIEEIEGANDNKGLFILWT